MQQQDHLLTTKRPGFFAACVALLISAPLSPLQAAPAEYQQCVACHGENAEGKPALKAPRLAGLDSAYIERQLINYKEGLRGKHADDLPGQKMRQIALQLKAEQQQKLAAFIAGLPMPAKPGPAADVANTGAGYWALCSACHGLKGQGNESLGAPRLAGMDADYLFRQLNNFKLRRRGAEPQDRFGQQMLPMVDLLPDRQAMKAVAEYSANLK